MPATTTRILLNHFKWDKEKLMERFYDGDQDKLFSEARVINPFKRSQPIIQRVKFIILVISYKAKLLIFIFLYFMVFFFSIFLIKHFC